MTKSKKYNRFLAVSGLALAAMFLLASKTQAASFPDIMISNTRATQDGQTYYGGLTGQYAVLNNDPNGSYGFNRTLVSPSNCRLFSPLLSQSCFVLGTGDVGTGDPGVSRMMTAKTTVNGQKVFELPALYFGGININGDVAGNLGYLLKFWGQNLYKGTDIADGASWNLGSYAFNPASQFIWNGEKFNQYKAKIATLAGSQTALTPGSFVGKPNFYLQDDAPLFLPNDITGGLAKYPDGGVWVADGDLTISQNIQYYFKGTLIIRGGDLTVTSGTNILPNAFSSDTQKDRFGIIVLKKDDGTKGNCNFNGNNEITAMVMCENSFNVGGNGKFTGSFVAGSFNIDQTKSTLFQYDAAFDDNQPPGFRDLKLSASQEVGNK